MIENEKDQQEKKAPDSSAEFVRDLATSSPPKGVEVVKAASDAVEKAGSRDKAGKSHDAIRTRAYELWEQSGCPEDRHMEFWLQAEKEADEA